jgi:hypothetical protein
MRASALSDVDRDTSESDDERPVLTGAVAAAYVATWMDASSRGEGLNAARVRGDAVAAQRGDRAARMRLFRAITPRTRCRVIARRPATNGRPRRRVVASRARARSPGRQRSATDSDPAPAERPLGRDLISEAA